jgi:hypothetical protein
MLLNVSPSLAVHTRNGEKQLLEEAINNMERRKAYTKYSTLKRNKASKRSVLLPILFILLTIVAAVVICFLFFCLAFLIALGGSKLADPILYIGSALTLLGSVWNIRKIIRNS